MIVAIPAFRPVGAALVRKLSDLVEIILHIGAHRTGTTSFQSVLRDRCSALCDAGIAVWDPRMTRRGIFAGLLPDSPCHSVRARGRVRLRLEDLRRSGIRTLLVSDENMMGSVRANIRSGRLYPDIGERLARHVDAFGGVSRVVMSIRSQDRWWASALAYGIERGQRVPAPDRLARIADRSRGWRDVISDAACAAGGAELRVLPFERHMGDASALLDEGCGLPVAGRRSAPWLHRSPSLPDLRQVLRDRGEDASRLPVGEGAWQPFDDAQAAAMREAYADDILWLAAGADGLATLTDMDQEEAGGRETGQIPQPRETLRGHFHERQERPVA